MTQNGQSAVNQIKERLTGLRRLMKEQHIDYYMIPTGDYHQSEYISDYFKEREYMSGFTGSAGTLLVTADMAGLWTDGRYFVQAERELAHTGISLFRMQEPGVPSVTEYIAERTEEGNVVAFDGRVVSTSFYDQLTEKTGNQLKVLTNTDLVDTIWKDRPERPAEPIYVLGEDCSGCPVQEKLVALRNRMKEYEADAVLLSTLDDIMWLYNLRGNDVSCNPVALSYAYITNDKAWFFAAGHAIGQGTGAYLQENQIIQLSYDSIERFLEQHTDNEDRLLLDENAVSLALYQAAGCTHQIISVPISSIIPKAVKNAVEIELCKDYHLSDAVAVTRFMYWLKTQADISQETELSVSSRLEQFRMQQKGYLGPSFETIAAYGENASMIHYSPDAETNTSLKEQGMILIDSGGQYLGATTDITRTIVLGELSYEQKKQYTAVVSGMLTLANARFLYGCTGRSLDILAREPLWKMGLDYRHGTGHGVGSFLSVHEGPQAFHWKQSQSLPEAVLEPGMVITDEPGYYEENSHGIRIENELLCVERSHNEWGRYLGFEILTLVPIDLDAILPEEMSGECKNMLNVYHRRVYEQLCPYLTDNEKKWLFSQTKEI